jgi:hypothetical protein
MNPTTFEALNRRRLVVSAQVMEKFPCYYHSPLNHLKNILFDSSRKELIESRE